MTDYANLLHERIIDKTIGVFMTKGYEGTSVKDLVDATGLHPGSLYNAFGSKLGIFEAAIERFDAASPFNQLLAQAETAPPHETIRALLDTLIDPKEEAGKVAGCLITYAAAEIGVAHPGLARRLDRAFQEMEDNLCILVERGQALGEFASKRKPRDLAKLLLSTIQGIQVMAKVSHDRQQLRPATTVVFDILEPVA